MAGLQHSTPYSMDFQPRPNVVRIYVDLVFIVISGVIVQAERAVTLICSFLSSSSYSLPIQDTQVAYRVSLNP